MSGHLYVVGTPIGNLGDLSDRARETLAAVDLVAAEDTRRTGKLLSRAGIRARMLSLFEGNERQRIDELLERLSEGATVALVSDAGMPAVSDPGFRLLRAAVDAGIEISVVPGPSAVTAPRWWSPVCPPTDGCSRASAATPERTPLAAPSARPRPADRGAVRVPAAGCDAAPRRLVELGDRRAAVARELTKIHEEVLRGRVSEVLAMLLDSEPRGEIVVVLEGAETPEAALSEMVDEAGRLVRNGMRKREAAAAVARASGGSANEIYRALIDSRSRRTDAPRRRPRGRLKRRCRPTDASKGTTSGDRDRTDRMDRPQLPPPPTPRPLVFPLPPAPGSVRPGWAAPLVPAGGTRLSRSRSDWCSSCSLGSSRWSPPNLRREIRDPSSAARGRTRSSRTADGEPFRWDPCSTIHFQVDLGGVDDHVLDDVKEAVRRISRASGLRFEFDGVVHLSVTLLSSRGLRHGERRAALVAAPDRVPVPDGDARLSEERTASRSRSRPGWTPTSS